ncbi:MAG: tripartite tricarboxylate transporter permease [Candidatus Nanoarchaeia archaeon]
MLFEILLAVVVGCFLGVFTGLCPGVHINLVAVLILTYSVFFLKFVSPLFLAVVIASMSITHTFLDTIPSIFLGAPDSDTVLSVLPGHRMLIKGRGYEAVMLTVVGSLGALVIVIALTPLVVFAVSKGYPLIKPFIGFVLVFSSAFLIWREKKGRYWALVLFLLSGSVGILVLNVLTLNDPLFPMLSGLFGTSMLVISVRENTKIPKQKHKSITISKKCFWQALFSSVFSSSLCSFLPALGPTQAAIIGSQFCKRLGDKGFLVLVGGISTVNMALSFVSLYVIGKARNGSIVTMSEIISNFNSDLMILFLGVALLSACIATFLAVFFTSRFSAWICRVNYKALCISIVIFIVLLVIFLSGFLGLLVLCVSTFVGLFPAYLGIGRNHMMGCLILPVILYFFL